MKEYVVSVSIMANNKEDLIERMEDHNENPIDTWDDESISEVTKCPDCFHNSLINYPSINGVPAISKCRRCGYQK